jgi:hypothetical protein
MSSLRRPPVYNLKFALLHLIHGAELLLKTYVEQVEPRALFQPSSKHTISLRKALDFVVEHNPKLLLPQGIALLLEAKDLRNDVEHYKFSFAEGNLRALGIDFLGLWIFLSQTLLSVNLVEPSLGIVCDKPDPVGDCLAAVLRQAPEIGLRSARKAGELWASQNPCQIPLRELWCSISIGRPWHLHGLWGRGKRRSRRAH